MERPLSKALLVTALLALSEGGYMVVDAVHRFATGDFFRIDGQLGPWSAIVAGFGIDPLMMAPVFLAIGAVQAIGGAGILTRRPWARHVAIIMAAGTLWYLIFGTVSSAIQIGLLLYSRPRSSMAVPNPDSELPREKLASTLIAAPPVHRSPRCPRWLTCVRG
jgi:hypothetical protein